MGVVSEVEVSLNALLRLWGFVLLLFPYDFSFSQVISFTALLFNAVSKREVTWSTQSPLRKKKTRHLPSPALYLLHWSLGKTSKQDTGKHWHFRWICMHSLCINLLWSSIRYHANTELCMELIGHETSKTNSCVKWAKNKLNDAQSKQKWEPIEWQINLRT